MKMLINKKRLSLSSAHDGAFRFSPSPLPGFNAGLSPPSPPAGYAAFGCGASGHDAPSHPSPPAHYSYDDPLYHSYPPAHCHVFLLLHHSRSSSPYAALLLSDILCLSPFLERLHHFYPYLSELVGLSPSPSPSPSASLLPSSLFHQYLAQSLVRSCPLSLNRPKPSQRTLPEVHLVNGAPSFSYAVISLHCRGGSIF